MMLQIGHVSSILVLLLVVPGDALSFQPAERHSADVTSFHRKRDLKTPECSQETSAVEEIDIGDTCKTHPNKSPIRIVARHGHSVTFEVSQSWSERKWCNTNENAVNNVDWMITKFIDINGSPYCDTQGHIVFCDEGTTYTASCDESGTAEVDIWINDNWYGGPKGGSIYLGAPDDSLCPPTGFPEGCREDKFCHFKYRLRCTDDVHLVPENGHQCKTSPEPFDPIKVIDGDGETVNFAVTQVFGCDDDEPPFDHVDYMFTVFTTPDGVKYCDKKGPHGASTSSPLDCGTTYTFQAACTGGAAVVDLWLNDHSMFGPMPLTPPLAVSDADCPEDGFPDSCDPEKFCHFQYVLSCEPCGTMPPRVSVSPPTPAPTCVHQTPEQTYGKDFDRGCATKFEDVFDVYPETDLPVKVIERFGTEVAFELKLDQKGLSCDQDANSVSFVAVHFSDDACPAFVDLNTFSCGTRTFMADCSPLKTTTIRLYMFDLDLFERTDMDIDIPSHCNTDPPQMLFPQEQHKATMCFFEYELSCDPCTKVENSPPDLNSGAPPPTPPTTCVVQTPAETYGDKYDAGCKSNFDDVFGAFNNNFPVRVTERAVTSVTFDLTIGKRGELCTDSNEVEWAVVDLGGGRCEKQGCTIESHTVDCGVEGTTSIRLFIYDPAISPRIPEEPFIIPDYCGDEVPLSRSHMCFYEYELSCDPCKKVENEGPPRLNSPQETPSPKPPKTPPPTPSPTTASPPKTPPPTPSPTTASPPKTPSPTGTSANPPGPTCPPGIEIVGDIYCHSSITGFTLQYTCSKLDGSVEITSTSKEGITRTITKDGLDYGDVIEDSGVHGDVFTLFGEQGGKLGSWTSITILVDGTTRVEEIHHTSCSAIYDIGKQAPYDGDDPSNPNKGDPSKCFRVYRFLDKEDNFAGIPPIPSYAKPNPFEKGRSTEYYYEPGCGPDTVGQSPNPAALAAAPPPCPTDTSKSKKSKKGSKGSKDDDCTDDTGNSIAKTVPISASGTPSGPDEARLCDGKIGATTLQYRGASNITGPVVVVFSTKDCDVEYTLNGLNWGDTLCKESEGGYTLNCDGEKFDSKTSILINGVEEVIHTSCSAVYYSNWWAPLDDPKGDPSPNWFVMNYLQQTDGRFDGFPMSDVGTCAVETALTPGAFASVGAKTVSVTSGLPLCDEDSKSKSKKKKKSKTGEIDCIPVSSASAPAQSFGASGAGPNEERLCDDKIEATTLQYRGESITGSVVVVVSTKNCDVEYTLNGLNSGDTLCKESERGFTLDCDGEKFDSKTSIQINGVEEVIHTSCSAVYYSDWWAPLDDPKGDPSPRWFVMNYLQTDGRFDGPTDVGACAVETARARKRRQLPVVGAGFVSGESTERNLRGTLW